MLKPTVKRGLMLDFISDKIITPSNTSIERVYKLNNHNIKSGNVIYIMNRDLRVIDNWSMIFAINFANQNNLELNVIINLPEYSKQQESFLNQGVNYLKKQLEFYKINYIFSSKLPEKCAAVVFDFSPINFKNDYIKNINFAAYEIDSHNIIPARFISQKQEYSAATLRRKIYSNIGYFLTDYPEFKQHSLLFGNEILSKFIKNKLEFYSEYKNYATKKVTSGLSPYLHFGFIASQRVALEVIKSSCNRDNKEAFLEELIVRKELSDNFCLYSSKFNSLNDIPNWAKQTLKIHKNDIRSYIYSKSEFENYKTHDELWNKLQYKLIKTGSIHGYARMYWAKKILEWSKSPEDALNIAIYLNDKYALDGIDPNGYVGILWSIGGLHDRAFTNRFVTGKIRCINVNSKNKSYF